MQGGGAKPKFLSPCNCYIPVDPPSCEVTGQSQADDEFVELASPAPDQGDEVGSHLLRIPFWVYVCGYNRELSCLPMSFYIFYIYRIDS